MAENRCVCLVIGAFAWSSVGDWRRALGDCADRMTEGLLVTVERDVAVGMNI